MFTLLCIQISSKTLQQQQQQQTPESKTINFNGNKTAVDNPYTGSKQASH